MSSFLENQKSRLIESSFLCIIEMRGDFNGEVSTLWFTDLCLSSHWVSLLICMPGIWFWTLLYFIGHLHLIKNNIWGICFLRAGFNRIEMGMRGWYLWKGEWALRIDCLGTAKANMTHFTLLGRSWPYLLLYYKNYACQRTF